MYLRAAHAELHVPTLHQFIKCYPLGVITTALQSPSHPLLQCTHIPWVLDVSDPSSESDLGVLRGHLARANPHAKAMIEAAQSSPSHQLSEDVMVLFNGPVQHYVTPNFYTATKPVTGKVVPTWDYAAVQAYGKATIYFDAHAAETVEFLTQQIDDLTLHAETSVMGYEVEAAWGVVDAPEAYIELLRKAIVGIRVDVARLEGRFKMSQELAVGDREGMVKGFTEMGTEAGREMARWVKERGDGRKGGASQGTELSGRNVAGLE